VKYFLFIALFLVTNNLCLAQSELPWELERFDYGYYGSPGMNLKFVEDEIAVFEEYYRTYKRERMEKPDEYFPTPTPYRRQIKVYLSNANPDGDLLLLASFLESGTKSSLNELAESSYQNNATLPYRFLAALGDQNKIKAGYYLSKMDQNGMISSVLKAWGQNAVSDMNQNTYMTHGLQDLIGLCWALSELDELSQAIVFNAYLNMINNEFPSEDAFLQNYPYAWISPTYNSEFLIKHVKDLRLSGIGFKLSAYNATVQGNIFGDGRNRNNTINNTIFSMHLGLNVILNRLGLTFKYNYGTGEFDRTQVHRYGALRLFYRFN